MTPIEVPTFAILLQRYRRAAGLTQEALAERSGLSTRGISDLERGVSRTHRPDTVQRLGNALGLAARERRLLMQAALGAGRPIPGPQAAPSTSEPDAHIPFIGRRREHVLVDQLVSGQSAPVLVVAGEPGIGKSRLLKEAVIHAEGRGWTVLEGGCQRRGSGGLYAPLLGAIQRHLQGQSSLELRPALQGCAWLVRLLPELADGPIDPLPAWTLPPAQERRLMLEAVARYLANVAGPAGTLLVLDDLQWADADALDLLGMLVNPDSGAPPLALRVIGAYRQTEVQATDPLAALLADLARVDLVLHHRLTALSAAEAADLLAVLLERLPSRAAVDAALQAQVLDRTGGVPFFLISAVRGLRSGGGPWELPWDLAQTVRQRVAALPPVARMVLNVAAVAGRQVEGALLVSLAARPEEEVLAALEAACQAHLLEDTGEDGYRFAHDVIREVVETDLGSARRTVLHRRIAAVLDAALDERPAAVLAYHYARGGVPAKALHYLEQAGDQARAQHAHVSAAAYYREVVERLDGLGRTREAAAVREKLGAVLNTAGQYDAALAVLEQAVSTYQDAGERDGVWRVRAAQGHVHVHRGTPEDGVQRLQPFLDTLALADALPGTAALATLYEAVAFLYAHSGRYGAGLVAADRALSLARALNEEGIMAAALYERGSMLAELGRRGEALPALEEASRLAEMRGDLDTFCLALNLAGCVREDLGDLATAQRYTERALAAAALRGDPALIAYLTVRRGTGAFFSGDWSQARADFEHAQALCRQMGPSFASPFPPLDLGRLCLAEGSWAEAVRLLEESCAIARRSGDLNPLRWAQMELAEHDLLQGRPGAARERLEPLLGQPGLDEGLALFLLPPLAHAHLELGDSTQAAALAAQGVQQARTQLNKRALVNALRVQALILTRQQDWAGAEEAVQEGLELARAMPYPYAEARVLHVAGLLHLQRGEPGPARRRLEAAQALFQCLGARPETAQVARARAALNARTPGG